MSKGGAHRSAGERSSELDMDAALLEALAAVEARERGEDPAEIELEFDVPEPAPVAPRTAGAVDGFKGPERQREPTGPDPAEELVRLRVRLEEAQAAARRAEQDVRRAEEQRTLLEGQVQEVRAAHEVLSADFERLRARGRKDAEEAERRGEERALHALLDTFDNVERARVHAADVAGPLAEGLRMVSETLRRQVARLGLERVVAGRGTPFDPEVHEALVHMDAPDVLEGAVVDEILAGFRLRGRLFRAARVSVAAARVTEPTQNG
jgi:molecular chaperone GrpE